MSSERNPLTPEMSDLMTVAEVAAYLQVHPETVRVMARSGRIRSTRTALQGERAPYRFKRAWVEDYLEAQAKGGPPAPESWRKRRGRRGTPPQPS